MRLLTAPVLAAALTASVLLSGCSEIQDAASETAGNAACSVAQSALDGVAGQVDRIVEEIGADPAAAERELSGLRDTLATAEEGISGDAKDQIAEAGDAISRLADEAGRAADGVEVDTTAIDEAKQSFTDAVDGVRDIC